ncbi:hypothetical protein Pmani_038727 [Petrolisthes manimaculis]|uniref:Uncharacterized protein n=1 Tax=Petrolisthes manimaculis TaxID=1843537 RepID=A0AAE1NEK9_9EUCA|nr:hypothetical protein Pmani_038727 [Petrolisthes manimaculis]
MADLVFGCSGIAASLLIPLLPETNGAPMPETLQDVNKRWKNHRVMGGFFGAGVNKKKPATAQTAPRRTVTGSMEVRRTKALRTG